MKPYPIQRTRLLVYILLACGAFCLRLPDGLAFSGAIRIHDQRMWVNVKEARLDDVLTEIARQMEIRIEFYGREDHKITARMDNRPIEKGLKELLAQTDFSFVYQQDPSGEPGQTVLRQVVIITADPGNDPVLFDSGPAEPAVQKRTLFQAPVVVPALAGTAEETFSPEPDTVYGRGSSRKLAIKEAGRMAAQNLFSAAGAVPAVLNAQLSRKSGQEDNQDAVGLAIQSVDPDSGLSGLGFQPGDVVRNINGEQIRDVQKAEQILQASLKKQGGAMIRIEVERQGRIEPIYIEVHEPPPAGTALP